MAKKKPTPKKRVVKDSKSKNEAVTTQAPPTPIQTTNLTWLAIEHPELNITDLEIFRIYFSNGQNGTRAWMATHPDSKYDSASVSFHEWLRNPKISPIVEKIRNELAMDIAEGVSRLAAIARADMRHFLRKGSDGFTYLDLSNPEAEAYQYLIESAETKRERRIVGFGEDAEEFEGEWVKVKLHSAPGAIEKILKMHGKFVNRMEVTGKDGAPLVPPVDHEGYRESLIELANAVGEILSGKSPEATSEVGSKK